MKNQVLKLAPIFFLLLFTMTSCEAIASIFKAGFNVGIFVVILVIVAGVFLFGKMRK